MGGARFMGKDPGITWTPELSALSIFFYWLIGGLLICFFLAMLILPKPNLVIPISSYLIIAFVLGVRYFRIELKGTE